MAPGFGDLQTRRCNHSHCRAYFGVRTATKIGLTSPRLSDKSFQSTGVLCVPLSSRESSYLLGSLRGNGLPRCGAINAIVHRSRQVAAACARQACSKSQERNDMPLATALGVELCALKKLWRRRDHLPSRERRSHPQDRRAPSVRFRCGNTNCGGGQRCRTAEPPATVNTRNT